MGLKVKDIHRILENYAPSKLKESYDNVGLMVGDMEEEISSILVALDCTLSVIEEAKEKGCNLIFTHHPLFFRKPACITTDTLIGKKVINLIKNDINLYSSHTNLDSAEGGFNDIITEILGYKYFEIIEPNLHLGSCSQKAGIGRLVTLDKTTSLEDLCDKVKKALEISSLRYAGDDSMVIKKVAIINGSGEDFFSTCRKMGADCIITGDTTYHYVSDFKEENISIIDAGHFGTEWPALKGFMHILKNEIENMGYHNKIMLSESNKDPYKFK
ncbi:Nif3-like dinuclear metal center hexameric protein [Haloimpatiens sp. FM7330]|uniref:Nif3-like dinuclear metal center hexameric protein n=1 Tax=Haloimpatiens sp. FM7330 TaxID=3298610 RepID=UPI00364251CA